MHNSGFACKFLIAAPHSDCVELSASINMPLLFMSRWLVKGKKIKPASGGDGQPPPTLVAERATRGVCSAAFQAAISAFAEMPVPQRSAFQWPWRQRAGGKLIRSWK
jgi:hypothetical protein